MSVAAFTLTGSHPSVRPAHPKKSAGIHGNRDDLGVSSAALLIDLVFGAPAYTGATRVTENWFSLSVIATPSCQTGRRVSTGIFAGFLTVRAPHQGRGRVAAAERPGNAREVARFCGRPGTKRPAPSRSPAPNRTGEERFSVAEHVFIVRDGVHVVAGFVPNHLRALVRFMLRDGGQEVGGGEDLEIPVILALSRER